MVDAESSASMIHTIPLGASLAVLKSVELRQRIRGERKGQSCEWRRLRRIYVKPPTRSIKSRKVYFGGFAQFTREREPR